MDSSIFERAATGSFGDCECSSLDWPFGPDVGDIRCPRPATVITPEGWVLCQQHAELIEACAKAIA
jgi:hypothetical protein